MQELVHTLHFKLVRIKDDQQLLVIFSFCHLISNHGNRNDIRGVFGRFQNDRLVSILLVRVHFFYETYFDLARQIIKGGYGLRQLKVSDGSSQAETNVIDLLH